jgi:uncharacterized protein YacL
MVIFLIRVAIFLGSAALGLWVTSLLVEDVHLSTSGFLLAVAVFTVAQAVLTPFIASMARKYASAFLGGSRCSWRRRCPAASRSPAGSRRGSRRSSSCG